MQVLAPTLTDDLHRQLASDYKAAFFRLRTEGAMEPEPLFEGIPALLDHLAERGWLMGVATGKSDRGLARVLAEHGLAHHFVTLQTADRHPSKPDPAMVNASTAARQILAWLSTRVPSQSNRARRGRVIAPSYRAPPPGESVCAIPITCRGRSPA